MTACSSSFFSSLNCSASLTPWARKTEAAAKLCFILLDCRWQRVQLTTQCVSQHLHHTLGTGTTGMVQMLCFLSLNCCRQRYHSETRCICMRKWHIKFLQRNSPLLQHPAIKGFAYSFQSLESKIFHADTNMLVPDKSAANQTPVQLLTERCMPPEMYI